MKLSIYDTIPVKKINKTNRLVYLRTLFHLQISTFEIVILCACKYKYHNLVQLVLVLGLTTTPVLEQN